MKFRFTLFFIFFFSTLFSQRASDGENLFNSKQYTKARIVYQSLLKKKPTDVLFNYRFARCCYELKDYESAILPFGISRSKFPVSEMYLGEIFFKTYRFDESVLSYQNFISTLDTTDTKRPDFLKRLKKAENASRLFSKVEDIAIVDSISVNKSEFLKFYKFSTELGSLNQEILNLPHHRKADKIKYLTQRQDRMYFSDSIQGQMNIFNAFKLLDGWSKPTPVSEVINTQANENYPFVLLDGVTIYYASDGENSMGGYDIFVTRFNPATNSYLTPENIGFPFNSPANDYMMVIDEQNKLGWFATDRNQPNGKVVLYTFVSNGTKNYIRSDDKEYVRNVAQLINYRKVSENKAGILQLPAIVNSQPDQQIEFIINDTIVYTKVNQFKTQEGRKSWSELCKLTTELKRKQKELQNLRSSYNESHNSIRQATLVPQILDLESVIPELKKQITTLSSSIRKVELKNLIEK